MCNRNFEFVIDYEITKDIRNVITTLSIVGSDIKKSDVFKGVEFMSDHDFEEQVKKSFRRNLYGLMNNILDNGLPFKNTFGNVVDSKLVDGVEYISYHDSKGEVISIRRDEVMTSDYVDMFSELLLPKAEYHNRVIIDDVIKIGNEIRYELAMLDEDDTIKDVLKDIVDIVKEGEECSVTIVNDHFDLSVDYNNNIRLLTIKDNSTNSYLNDIPLKYYRYWMNCLIKTLKKIAR